MTHPASPASSKPAPSFARSLALAVGTVALSTWALGSLWASAERKSADVEEPATVEAPTLVAAAP